MCETTGLTPPAFENDHADGSCAILGGFVYGGNTVPEINGRCFLMDLAWGG